MIDIFDIKQAQILIVDDHEPNVFLLEQMLLEDGYQGVSSTTDPFEVCALQAINQYDLILLDLQMPGMDGFEIMDELKKNETHGYVPILVITSQPDHLLKALKSGAKDFITKPFNLMEAKVRIYNMLEIRLLYKQLEQYSLSMESYAMHDSLTGLPNRRLFIDRLTLAMAHAQRKNCTATVIYLDLDGFKKINDKYGHDAGDMLLKIVADRLVAAVRKEDTVSRFGGDEFVLVLWELDSDEGLSILLSKILSALSAPYFINGQSIKTSASAGVSTYPLHGQDIDSLIKSADIALYKSKHIGKNRFSLAAQDDE
ncbi:MAG: diguanylate cyclase [Methylotenera sp.]|uniref:GGDEF domain-containing response regulator n=1 Tax=Methylotenera sp. TaxID=2051956 RepID=UPI00248A09B9|nr:diguanylate cyclase [Methylotenera sp.]MDI1309979.1 diguanylate cyclase [Methylotenera sp.]